MQACDAYPGTRVPGNLRYVRSKARAKVVDSVPKLCIPGYPAGDEKGHQVLKYLQTRHLTTFFLHRGPRKEVTMHFLSPRCSVWSILCVVLIVFACDSRSVHAFSSSGVVSIMRPLFRPTCLVSFCRAAVPPRAGMPAVTRIRQLYAYTCAVVILHDDAMECITSLVLLAAC